jgi:LacI family transcriptional regulator
MATVTIHSVAQEVGISVASVSRILNQVPGYRHDAETQRRVREVAVRLGYRPHSAASILRARRTYLIGIFAQRFGNEYSALLRDALVKALQKHPPYRPMFIDPLIFAEEGGMRSFGTEFIEGLLWTLPAQQDELLSRVLARTERRPEVVTINRQYPFDASVPSIRVDGVTATRQAIEYLLDLGHRRIAILYRAPKRTSVRYQGFARAMKSRSVAIDEALCLKLSEEYEPDSYLEDGFRLTKQLLEYGSGAPTAILCHNNSVAGGALQAAYRMGVKVPDDLSVVSFGLAHSARYAVPPLTCVEEPVEQIAVAAVNLLVAQLEDTAPADRDEPRLACTLQLRESCAPPARGRKSKEGKSKYGAA